MTTVNEASFNSVNRIYKDLYKDIHSHQSFTKLGPHVRVFYKSEPNTTLTLTREFAVEISFQQHGT